MKLFDLLKMPKNKSKAGKKDKGAAASSGEADAASTSEASASAKSDEVVVATAKEPETDGATASPIVEVAIEAKPEASPKVATKDPLPDTPKTDGKKASKSPEETAVKKEENAKDAKKSNGSTKDNAKAKEPKKETESEVISDVLDKLGLSSGEFSLQEKLDAVCLIFKQTVAENVKYKEKVANLEEQLEKNELTKTAMQKLCTALKTQIELKDEETNLKLQDETQKRIDITKSFEATMTELSKLIETHSAHNTSLREENKTMANKLNELLKEFESRETKIDMISEEFKLKTQLYETQLAKAKVEKAEMAADFNSERLQLNKSLVEAKKQIDMMMSREDNLREQVDLYEAQYNAMEKGIDDKKANFGRFRNEIEKLTKKLQKVELDTAMWKDKFEDANEQVRKMNVNTASLEKDLETSKKKLAAMEKLNRALTSERSKLMEDSKRLSTLISDSNGDN